MSNATVFDAPTVPRLQALLEEVRQGGLLIPRFQRPFVWKTEQRFRLLDSVNKGLPMGSLMVWRSSQDRDLKCYEHIGPFRLQPTSGRAGRRSYLLDGLQRLTTLYAALHPVSLDIDDDDDEALQEEESDDEENPTRWPIYFDLEVEKEQKKSADHGFRLARDVKDWKPPQTWLPLHALFDPEQLYAFQVELIKSGQSSLGRAAERLASRFKDYPVPLIPIVTDDLELVTESFQRVNSEGTKMSEQHMLGALTFGRPYDSAQGLHQISKRLAGRGWGKVSDTLLLNAVKAAFDIELQKQHVSEIKEKLKENGDGAIFDILADAAESAVTFLASCGIVGPALLPYDYQLVALIDAARLVGDLAGEPVAERLKQWLWATTYARHFTSMNSTQLGQVLAHVRQVVKAEVVDPIPVGLNRNIEPHNRFSFTSARSTAFAILLANQGPRDEDGRQIDAFDYLAAEGNKALALVLPKASATDPANRFIASPGDVRGLREALLDPKRPQYREICESHLIEPDAATALLEERHDDFLALRKQTIAVVEAVEIRQWGLTPPDVPGRGGRVMPMAKHARPFRPLKHLR